MSVLDNPGTRILQSLLIGGILFALLLFLLPTYAMPEGLVSALAWLFSTLWSFDFLLPVITMLTCFQIVILTEILLASVKFATYFYRLFTTST